MSILGWVMSALGVVLIFIEPTLAAFAILYSLGNLTNIMSYDFSFFLRLQISLKIHLLGQDF